MSDAYIKTIDGKPRLFIDDKLTDAAAYVTYFTEREHYRDFFEAGYSLYSVCAYFTSLPINEQSGFTPARLGIFDQSDEGDFEEIDRDMHDLLRKVPEAKVFLRVYISMPKRWCEAHPTEICPTKDTPCGRELLYSDAFRRDGGALLGRFISHVRTSDYASAIIGYQLSGGGTQEWFHHDRDGARCENALPYFRKFMEENHPGISVDGLPPRYRKGESAEGVSDYFLEFENRSVARTVEYFCKVAKECVQNRQIVGTFYGYSVEVTEPDTGSHALTDILDSLYIDFFDSPVSYTGDRALGIDWLAMLPEDSLALHGKLYFVEADVRTHLSLYPDECRPGHFRQLYRHPIWKGGPTEEASVCQIRKAFAKILTHSGAFWWFDMWGGWYWSPVLMGEMRLYRSLLKEADPTVAGDGKIALFLDERGARRLGGSDDCRTTLLRLGNLGVPYDLYLIEDFERVADRYVAVGFLPGVDSKYLSTSHKVCEKKRITVLDLSLPLFELRAMARRAGVGFFTDDDDVLYVGNGYLALHSAKEGLKTVHLPRPFRVESVWGDKTVTEENVITFRLSANETKIFRLLPLA